MITSATPHMTIPCLSYRLILFHNNYKVFHPLRTNCVIFFLTNIFVKTINFSIQGLTGMRGVRHEGEGKISCPKR